MRILSSSDWVRHFEANRLDRPEPDWDRPCGEDADVRARLARSLAHFQLGESGDGRNLLAEARRAYPDDPGYVEALRLFVGEEQEHARLLERLVARFSGTLVTRHWTHRCFSVLRRVLGLHFEIQTLVIAEIIGTIYYRLLRMGVSDTVLVHVCDLMLRDEAPHLEFHSQRMAERLADRLPIERFLWAAQFQTFFVPAVYVAWLDHRPALAAAGADRSRFLAEARRECGAFLAAVDCYAAGPGITAVPTSSTSAAGSKRRVTPNSAIGG